MLVKYTLSLRTCTTDHGGCIGKCDGKTALPFREREFYWPASLLGRLGYYRFHTEGTYVPGGIQWVVRDYDCLIIHTGMNLELTLLRFMADVVMRDQRMRDIPVQVHA